MKRNRIFYFILIIITVAAGLASRQINPESNSWVKLYLGDAIWALAVFLFAGFLFNQKSSFWVAALALIFSFCIEASQLYHAEWIDVIRANKIGGLILGFGFLWSDFICYTIGIGVGYMAERGLLRKID